VIALAQVEIAATSMDGLDAPGLLQRAFDEVRMWGNVDVQRMQAHDRLPTISGYHFKCVPPVVRLPPTHLLFFATREFV
jgi:hypothetical protein